MLTERVNHAYPSFLVPADFHFLVTLGSPVLVSGCSNSSSPGGVQVNANKEEQKLLHDQIQKGIAKRPVTKRR